jgi:glycosyltransferase involved in cell wall biosynthesis
MWVQDTYVTSRDMVRMRNESRSFEYRPLISILLPTYSPKRLWLERALDSLLSQAYGNWELCVCDDASPSEHVQETLARYEKLDERIKVKYLDQNENICRATNHALSLASGEYIGLLDHDDELAPHALYEMVKLLQEHRNADLIFSDEDKVDEQGKRLVPHMKIGWSPDLALSANYLCHFSIYRKTLLDQLEGWREGYDGAQDLDLVLRFSEIAENIHHIPKVLYHWRMVEGSTALSAEGKLYTHERARQSVSDAVERRGIAGRVEDGFFPNTFRVRREIQNEPLVSIVIPVRGKPPLEMCTESLRTNAGYENYEVIFADTGDVEYETRRYMESSVSETVRLDAGSNLSDLLNVAVERASGDYVLLLDPHVEAASSAWLNEMLQHAQRPEVGAVGAKLDYPNGDVYQAGLILDSGEESESPNGVPRFYRNADRQTLGWQAFFQLTRNCSALSSACMMFERAEFRELGGLDAGNFPDEFADVDLSLRLRERGGLLVYTPYAEFRYHGKPYRHQPLDWAQSERVRKRWGRNLERDPYHNPVLDWRPGDLRAIMGKPPTPHPAELSGNGDQSPPQADTGAAPAPPMPESVAEDNIGSVSFPPPFFIVGHGRSGTTWLELSLNSHPELVCKGSAMFFGREMDLFDTQRTLPVALANTPDLRTWHDMRPNYWSERSFEDELPGMVKALADHTMGSTLLGSGKSMVGDRTPHYVGYLQEIYELYPDARVIHVIRDGRDVAISNQHAVWQNARDRGGPVDLEPESLSKRDAYLEDREAFLEAGESLFTDEELQRLAGSWAGVVRRGRRQGRQLFGDNYLETRYENLLDDPEAELGRILGFLGANTDSTLVRNISEKNSFENVTGRGRGEEEPASFNRRGEAGEWREIFTREDRRVFEESAGELLSELGYDSAEASPGLPAKASPKPPAVMRSELTSTPFFAVGHGRSGTTWLERILNSHPEVLCKGSAMFFGKKRSLYEGRKTLYAALEGSEDLRLWHGMQANYWSERTYEEEVPGMVRALADHVMGTALAQSGKRVVGDRTPHHVSHLAEIRELYPRAKVIHIIRDGRDVAISNLHAVWNSARDRGGPVDLRPEDLERRDAYLANPQAHLENGESIFSEFRINELAKSWAAIIEKGRDEGRALFRDNYLELRYERLLQDPVPELERLFAFLEVDPSLELMQRIASENSFEQMSGRKPGQEKTDSFFRKGVQGDWHNILNDRDRSAFKQHAGKLLIELGYERDLDW